MHVRAKYLTALCRRISRSFFVTHCTFFRTHRPNVPTSHDYKKSFFVALRRAWFVFDEDRLQLVKAVLRRDDQLTDSQIDAKMYYDFAFFRDRVPRRVPPPAEHYRRVRAVFALFGPLLDSTTRRPLFNQEAWNKARNVLDEIIAGHCADPPDFAMYMARVDDDGNPVKDSRGLHLYDSMRGTNLTECAHKQMLAAIGAWPCGVETGDCLLSEWRHRYNHRIAERRRPGFPCVGHVDTWLVDTLQHLVQQNRRIDLFPGWVPASDFVDTPEQFGTVPLHSAALGDAIRAIRLKESVKLEGDHAYIAKCMKLPLPPLPVYTTKAKALFRKIVRPYIESMDFDKMAIEWCQHVDGQDIMPVLPAHLRSHFALWQRSERVQDAMDKAESGVAALANLNKQTAAMYVEESIRCKLSLACIVSFSGFYLPLDVVFVGCVYQCACQAESANNSGCFAFDTIAGRCYRPSSGRVAHREGSTGLDDRREAPAWSAWQGSYPTEAAPLCHL